MNESITIQKLHHILRNSGLVSSKRQTAGLVKGYRPRLPGYVIEERKRPNPEWSGLGFRKQLPKQLPTGIFEIWHTDKSRLGDVSAALTAARIEHVVDNKIVVGEHNP